MVEAGEMGGNRRVKEMAKLDERAGGMGKVPRTVGAGLSVATRLSGFREKGTRPGLRIWKLNHWTSFHSPWPSR